MISLAPHPVDDLPPLREVLNSHQLWADKKFGQNFLLDLNLTEKIVRLTRENFTGDFSALHILEIGPGPGGLTRALIKNNPRALTVIEMDNRFNPVLETLKATSISPFSIIQGDAVGFDINQLAGPKAVIANLPYNVGTVLLTDWLSNAHDVGFISVMLQKEVVDRITAKKGDKAYGRLAVFCQYLCRCTRLMTVPASAFTPAPKVESAVIMLTPRPDYAQRLNLVPALEALTAAAFGQRRKMIRSSLKGFLTRHPEALIKTNIPETARAEELDMNDFIALAQIATERTDQ